ncbi:LacI family DNA-binding transcriptional regulator [Leifsonia poae]|uniref:LacI family DNA-binding transcriptional regulator n=1 Tax=Leifsonia poae TaxID=110933 RepID=UPI001CBA7E87|nr:LacI family DNA-binding transcriptional regulator [Leifsonia poae]
MLTMKDIASHVGVSVSSVSLVLSGRGGGRVKPQVAAEIQAVAEELGYVPNQLARSLKTKQSRTIGVVSDRVATVPFSGHMLAGAQQAAWESGFMLMLIDTGGNDDLQTPAVQSLLQRNIESLIVATTFHRLVELPFVPPAMPVVILDGRPNDDVDAVVDFVVPDEESGAYTATKMLVEAGHRRIGFCNVAAYPIASRLRARGYERALLDAGITPDPSLSVVAEDAATALAIEPARRLLERADRPTAVFGFSDQTAMGFYHVARRLGLEIPRDLSLVGFDNQEFVAEALDPGLTTVQLPHREMGEWAVRRALDRLEGRVGSGESTGRLMPCPPVIRNSIGPPPG